MDDRIGQQLGNYRLTRKLGQGGFADVYLGEHIHLNTHQAAIKVLRAQLTSEDIEKFRLEARILANLVHPHIVRLLDYHVEGNTSFLTMSYAPNGTLRQLYAKRTKLPFTTIISYVQQLASAIQSAHNEMLVHRDLKPENILLGRQNELLLSDFGIATLTHSGRSQSLEQVAGTAVYMAPEQLQGKPRRSSDQYALGIIVYEWLCGSVPFQGSFIQLAKQHLYAPVLSLCEQVFSLPLAVEKVVFRALAKEPQKRFASVSEFAQALVAALEQAIQVASEPTMEDKRPLAALPTEINPPVQQKFSLGSHITAKEQLLLKGSTHLKAKQYQEALTAYSQAIQHDPKYASAYGRRGQVYALLKDYKRALKDFDQALALDPNLSWVKPERAYVSQQLKSK